MFVVNNGIRSCAEGNRVHYCTGTVRLQGNVIMSNQAVGNVYQTIIDEVINSSRVDFEESGVEESVLEELRQVRRATTV